MNHPATPTPTDLPKALRQTLWTLAEHNALYFGENHSTVAQARDALAALTASAPAASSAAPVCPTCGTHEIAILRECHNSACSEYATTPAVYEGWKTAAPTTEQSSEVAQRSGEAAAIVDALAAMQEPLGDEFQRVLDANRHELYAEAEPQAGAESYPPLPDPGINTASHAHFRVIGYTKDQMRAFADATAALRARGAVPIGEVESSLRFTGGFHVRLHRSKTAPDIGTLVYTAAPAAPMSAQPSDADLISAAGGDSGEEAASWQFSREELLHLLRSVLERWGAPAALPGEQDAARYRWLRDPKTDVSLVLDKRTGYVPMDEQVPGVGGYHTYEYRAGAELDAAIDVAMAAAKGRDAGGDAQ